MRESDISQVRDLERQAFTTTWQEEAFRNELRNNPAAVYIVLREPGNDRLAGYAGFWLVEDEAHVTSIAILPELRGGGAGSRLLFSLVCQARDRGARWVTLEVRADNVPAQKLYKRFGFAKVGTRKNYYEGIVDGWILWAGNLQSVLYRQRLLAIAEKWPEIPEELGELK